MTKILEVYGGSMVEGQSLEQEVMHIKTIYP